MPDSIASLRQKGLFLGIVLWLFMFGLTCYGIGWPPTLTRLIALAIGAIIGLVGCVYLYHTWDPIKLQPKNKQRATLEGKTVAIVIVGSIVTLRVTGNIFDENQRLFAAIVLSTSVVLVIGYMLIRAWTHSPRA